MTATMMAGFSSEFVELEKEAKVGKYLAGLALAGGLAAGVKAAPKMMSQAKPAITQAVAKPARTMLRPMGMTAGQMADKDVASALSFR